MSINITDQTIGLWVVDMPDVKANWLCAVSVDGDDYHLIYRIRTLVDDKIFNSADKKAWFEARIPTSKVSREDVIANMRDVAEQLWKEGGGDRYEILADERGAKGILIEMMKIPMMHPEKKRVH